MAKVLQPLMEKYKLPKTFEFYKRVAS